MKKTVIILSTIIVIMIIGIIYFSMDKKFVPPKFEENVKTFEKVPNEDKIIRVNDDYAFYIDGIAKVKDKYIYVNFYSLTNDKTYLKVRVLQDDVIIAESGLLKKNEFVEKLKMKRSLIESKRITYLVMSYEKDTYYSLGEVRLNPTLKK